MMTIRSSLVISCALIALALSPATAQQVVLKGVSATPEKTLYARKFERLIEEVNTKGKGLIEIRYLGGAPKVMGVFEVGRNLKEGVVDIANLTNGFYTNVMPEADAWKLLEYSFAELRGPQKKALDYMQGLYRERMNAFLLGQQYEAHSFHIYLNKPIQKADLTGLKIRVSPVYRAMVETLGGTAVTTAPPDAYTMLERGTVDGYGWPLHGIFDFSWQKVTKYRVEPPFYRGEMSILVNLTTWNKLNDAQKKLLQDAALALEAPDADEAKAAADERKRQAEAGIQPIQLPAGEAAKWIETSRVAGWAAVLRASPQHGATLKELFTRK